MKRPDDQHIPEELRQLLEEMDQIRERRIETRKKAEQVYEQMKRWDPEYWKAFGFATEDEYLRYYNLHNVLNDDLL